MGKRIIYAARGVISEQEFKSVDQVLLPKDELCLRFIAVRMKAYFLVSIPILLRSSSYKREKYLFSPVLVAGHE